MSNNIFDDLPQDSKVTEIGEDKAFAQSQRYNGMSQPEYRARNRDYKIQLKARRVRWARRIFVAIFVYIAAILLVFIAIGCSSLKYNSSVVNVFLGTTSIHIIGLAYVVANWLFPHSKKSKTPNAS